MIDYQKDLDRFMIEINTMNAAGVWSALELDKEVGVETSDKFERFREFFSFAIRNNRIIEYDSFKHTAIFSGDDPDVVVRRIFHDFPLEQLPRYEAEKNKVFLKYMLTKFDSWAVLNEGTRLCIPD